MVRAMMEEHEIFYGLFFSIFIIVTNFMMMSLLVGVLVDNLTSATETADLQLISQVRGQQEELQDELSEVFDRVDKNRNGTISLYEFKSALLVDVELRGKVLKSLKYVYNIHLTR